MLKRTAAALLVLAALAAPAAGQTVGFAQAVDILARACGADIDRHCRSATLANNGITRCLSEANVSQGCASALVEVRSSIAARLEAQRSAERICNRDIQQYCNPRLVRPGRGNILRCLLKAEPSVSAACNQAITDAGWR